MDHRQSQSCRGVREYIGEALRCKDRRGELRPLNGSPLRLWHPADARDAAQEILLRVVTHLSSFRHESSFLTWVYRLATNTLLNFRKSRLERETYDFDRFGRQLDQGFSERPSH